MAYNQKFSLIGALLGLAVFLSAIVFFVFNFTIEIPFVPIVLGLITFFALIGIIVGTSGAAKHVRDSRYLNQSFNQKASIKALILGLFSCLMFIFFTVGNFIDITLLPVLIGVFIVLFGVIVFIRGRGVRSSSHTSSESYPPSPPAYSQTDLINAPPPSISPSDFDSQFCPNCGVSMPNNSQFCSSCGSKVT
ncbi:MAG: zinc ribbon domain-containing protein [Candidatus Hodarchaeota archaeon]